MRAILKFNFKPQERDDTKARETVDIVDVFEAMAWLPLAETSKETKKKEILSTVAADDTEITEGTCRCVIYDNHTKTWGVINEPTGNRFEARLKNKDPDSLKTACEEFVKGVRGYTEKSQKSKFVFYTTVYVLEPHSEIHAFFGNVLPRRKFKLAIHQRNAQAWAGVVALLLGLVSIYLSYPEVWKATSEIDKWVHGNLERFSTAMLVSIVFSWLPVLQRYQELRQEDVIEWVLSK